MMSLPTEGMRPSVARAALALLRLSREELTGAMDLYANHPDGMGQAYRETSAIRRAIDTFLERHGS